jgi:protein-disulfide isomerase
MKRDLLKPRADDHLVGSSSAPVVLIEYADFQCPYCGAAEGHLKRIRDVYSEDLLFIFRQFPLVDVHEWAQLAALASEAAGLQGKFWEAHDRLFEIQESLDPQAIHDMAGELGLDMPRFASDINGPACRARVDRDLRSGEALGLPGTPSLFINGQYFDQEVSFSTLSAAVSGWLVRKKIA